MSGPVAHLYVVRIGEKVKIGISGHPETRYRQYQTEARRAGVEMEPLLELPEHVEARDNERALLSQFGTRGSISEYLDADPAKVIAFVRTLPCTPPPPLPAKVRNVDPTEKWLRRTEAAEMLKVSTHTIDKYVKRGYLARYDLAGSSRMPRFRIEDVRAVRDAWVAP